MRRGLGAFGLSRRERREALVAEPGGVLVILCVTLFLIAAGAYGIARVVQALLRRNGLDLMSVLLWLGLAERPIEPGPPRPGRLEQLAS